jgi:general secretion pathway protein H
LIEIVVVLFLFGVVLAFVLPRTDLTVTVSSSSRQLIGAMRSLFTAASLTQRVHRLYFDLNQGSFWAMQLTAEGERPPSDPSLARRVILPSGIKIQDVNTFQQGKVGSGQAFVQFFPLGRAEQAVIHLADDEQNVLTLMLNPLTGGVRVSNGYVEPTIAEPIPDRLRPYLLVAPSSTPPAAVPSGGGLK